MVTFVLFCLVNVVVIVGIVMNMRARREEVAYVEGLYRSYKDQS